jgi:hypothetical protein
MPTEVERAVEGGWVEREGVYINIDSPSLPSPSTRRTSTFRLFLHGSKSLGFDTKPTFTHPFMSLEDLKKECSRPSLFWQIYRAGVDHERMRQACKSVDRQNMRNGMTSRRPARRLQLA